jgi:hypothetical protein
VTEPHPRHNLPWKDGWTEVGRSDEVVEHINAFGPGPIPDFAPSPGEVRRVLEDALRDRGIDVDDLDFSSDVRTAHYVRQIGWFIHHFYGVAVRTERLPGTR